MKLFLACLFIACLLPCANAAQNAKVSTESAQIVAEPNQTATPVEKVKLGDILRVSSFQKDGFYKVKLRSAEGFGWIWNGQVTLLYDTATVKATNVDLASPHRDKKPRKIQTFFVRPSLVAWMYSSLNVGGFRFLYYITPGLNLDMAVRLDNESRLALRTGYYQSSLGTDNTFSIQRTGYPVLLGYESDIWKNNFWTHSLVFLGGVDFNTVTLKATKAANPSQSASSKMDPLLGLSYLVKRKIGSNMKFILELGAYYSPSVSSGLSEAKFLAPVGNPNTVTKRFSGPLVALGLEFGF